MVTTMTSRWLFSIGDLHFTVLLTTMVYNHMFGPWLGAAFWGQLLEVVEEYLDVLTLDDPLLQHLSSFIAEERGEIDLTNAAYPQVIKDLSKECATTWGKGSRTKLCVWNSWCTVAQEWDTCWYTRQLVMLFIGINAGYIKRGPAATLRMKRPKVSAVESEGSSRPVTQQGSQQISKLT